MEEFYLLKVNKMDFFSQKTLVFLPNGAILDMSHKNRPIRFGSTSVVCVKVKTNVG